MSTIISKLPTAARILLGLVFAFASITALLGIAMPMKLDAPGAQFVGGLAASGYFFPLLKSVELTGAILLLTGIAVPFALVMLAPVAVNVFAFHLFLAPDGLPVAVFLVVAELYLAWSYRHVFAPLFKRQRPMPSLQAAASLSAPVRAA